MLKPPGSWYFVPAALPKLYRRHTREEKIQKAGHGGEQARLVPLAWNIKYKKKGEKQDKKNSYSLANCPIIKNRYLKKNINIGTM